MGCGYGVTSFSGSELNAQKTAHKGKGQGNSLKRVDNEYAFLGGLVTGESIFYLVKKGLAVTPMS